MGDITVSGLRIYPIKSFGGISLEISIVERSGLQHDRKWMLVDQDGRFMSQRSDTRLALFRLHLAPGGFTVSRPDSEQCFVPFETTGQKRLVSVWKSECEALQVSEEVDQWFSDYLNQKCSLVTMPESFQRQTSLDYTQPGDHTGFADAFQVLVAGEASLEDLNSKLSTPVPMNRFRPNIVICGSSPFEEDTWNGFELGGVPFRFAKICGRCAVTATNQETGEVGVEPLKTLAAYRKFDSNVYFGAYFVPENGGEIRVGQKLDLK